MRRSKILSVCLSPGCHALTDGTYCKVHLQQRERERGSRHERGYGSAWVRLSREILERDQYVCWYCGGVATETDHVVAKANGGTDDPENLVAACKPCNVAKRDR